MGKNPLATNMPDQERTYIAIDLKSFYSSAECATRELDPLTTNLVVADTSRTNKTICLAISPSMKAYGLPGRARLFEVIQKMHKVNEERLKKTTHGYFKGKSVSTVELAKDPDLQADYITATPRMAEYIRISSKIYEIYLKYIAQEDIYVYSIDEIFADITEYLNTYKKTAHELTMDMVRDVQKTTGITATAGIGSNLYLCKVAMDIVAKHIPADKNGVRIAELTEKTYRKKLWNHKPLTDFWRFGHGIAEQLEQYGIDTMGKLARMSINNEDFLYNLFGVNAELIIDHAWGWEPVTIASIKAYKPDNNSLGNGQVLQCPYSMDKARVVAKEMAESIALNLMEKHLVGSEIVLAIGYDKSCQDRSDLNQQHPHDITPYGHHKKSHTNAHGTMKLEHPTSSSRLIAEATIKTFNLIANPAMPIRRIYLTIIGIINEDAIPKRHRQPMQLDLFTDYTKQKTQSEKEESELVKERKLQEASLKIKKEFGNNALLKGLNFAEGSTQKERNKQIGGHKA